MKLCRSSGVDRGELLLDTARHACTWKGLTVDLTVTEFLLLKSLAMRPGHVKNCDQLIDAAYGEHIYVDDRTIDSHIKRLRKKFRDTDFEFSQIETSTASATVIATSSDAPFPFTPLRLAADMADPGGQYAGPGDPGRRLVLSGSIS